MRQPCCEKERINKGAWSKQEDQKLIDYIKAHGEGCWRSLPKAAGLHRCGKSCRLRWINYLRPDIKRGNFAQDEEDLIIKLHALLGNRWSLIAGRLPGRTDNEVKNYWNSHIRKKLIRMGIDPNNHKPHQHLMPISNQINDQVPLHPRPAPSHASQITQSSSSADSMDEEQSSKPTHHYSNCNNIVTSGSGERCMVSDHAEAAVTAVTSCVEQDETDTSPAPLASADLNLDLSIAVPVIPQRSPGSDWEEKGKGPDGLFYSCVVDDSSSNLAAAMVVSNAAAPSQQVEAVGQPSPTPTLLLFR